MQSKDSADSAGRSPGVFPDEIPDLLVCFFARQRAWVLGAESDCFARSAIEVLFGVLWHARAADCRLRWGPV